VKKHADPDIGIQHGGSLGSIHDMCAKKPFIMVHVIRKNQVKEARGDLSDDVSSFECRVAFFG